jgi:predicted  nucleic acid-binding Zn-ribbon protein
MKLTPQAIQDARRAQSVVTCGFCGRLLYWKT